MKRSRTQCAIQAALSLYVGLASSFTSGALARADEPHDRTSSLSWVRLDGAESCIATQALAQAVEERLKRKVFVSASEADVSVEGHVERTKSPARWRAGFTIRDARGNLLGTRDIESGGRECSTLDDQIVFVVSVLIDPEADSATPPAPPAKPVEPPAPPPPPQIIVRRERVLVPVATKEPWRVEASAGAAGAVGLLPGPSIGVTAAAVVEPPSFWGILLSGTYWAGASVTVAGGAESEISLAYGGLGLCPIRWAQWRWSYRLCAAVEVGSTRSRGVGFDTERTDEKLAVHALLPNRFGLRVVGPLVATLGLALVVPLVRNELTYRTADGTSHVLFQPSPIAAAADLGLALYFPR